MPVYKGPGIVISVLILKKIAYMTSIVRKLCFINTFATEKRQQTISIQIFVEQEVQKLDFEYQVAADIFTDIIEVRISDDTVCLGLGIKSGDKKTAVIKTRVFMTISHFNRFINVGNGLLDQIKLEIAKNQTKKDSPT